MRLYAPQCRFECEQGWEDNYCGESDEKGFYICTRKIGHKGNHVACGTIEHEVKIWR